MERMNFRKHVLFWNVATLFLWAHPLAAQDVKMSIDDLFMRVEQHNIDVKIARQNVNISNEQKKSAVAKQLPDINFSAAVNYLGDATLLDRDFSNVTRSAMPHLGNAIALSLYQPIYAGGEISAGIEKANNKRHIADNELERVSDKMKMEILGCYLDLFKHRNLLAVYDENIELTQQLLSEMRARSAQGLALANDVTRYELNLSNLKYDRLTVADGIEHLNNNLLIFLSLDENTNIIPQLQFNEMNEGTSSSMVWMERALQHSPELKKIDLNYTLSQTESKLIKSRRLPKIGLTVGDNLDGPITNKTPVLDKNLNRWWAGVQFSLNLSSLYKDQGTLKAARLESIKLLDQRKSQTEEISRRIDQLYKYYTEANEQAKTQELNVQLATENYRIVERRYSNDLSLLTDMLDASAQKLDAEVRLVNARTNVIYYYYQLKYISGTL